MQVRDCEGLAGVGVLPSAEPWDFTRDPGKNEGGAGQGVPGTIREEEQRRQVLEFLGGELPVGDSFGDVPATVVVVGGFSCPFERYYLWHKRLQ